MPKVGTGSKNESGYSKRKRKQKEVEFIQSQQGALLKHLRTDSAAVIDPEVAPESVQASQSVPSTSVLDDSTPKSQECEDLTVSVDKAKFDATDIGLWGSNPNDQHRKFIVECGPIRVTSSSYDYPLNSDKRHFSDKFYSRKMQNQEAIDRRWLVYSKSLDSVFCFCCKLFSNSDIKLCKDGYNNWKHLADSITSHETSTKHLECFHIWIEMENRLKTSQTIDSASEKAMNMEKEHWRLVLERLLSIVQFLSQRNLSFRGSNEQLYNPKNGNFLGLVELISKFDPVLLEHLRRISTGDIKDHYLGNRIQNEFIELISEKVLESIGSSVKKSKYFSVILDCTPDIGHQEQMTVVLRSVNCSENSIEIVERFVGFLAVNDSTGLGLMEAFLKKIVDLGLSIEDCRGQGYDNGANMRGCHKGVQARILELNPKALFVPCGCHSWNLVLGDMARSSTIAKSFFGIIQQIYVLFSASTHRWSIFKKHVQRLTVKPLSETRWECRVESIKAIRYQVGDVYDALVEVSEVSNDTKSRTEAASLAKEMKNFQFLTALCIWYDILAQFNVVSKVMQSSGMKINHALQLIENMLQFLKEYKENGYSNAQISAKELAEELEMNPNEMIFPPVTSLRRKKIKKQFSYEAEDEQIHDPEKKFQVGFFNVLLDQATMSTKERFHQMKAFHSSFGFLFDLTNIRKMADHDLLKECKDLQILMDDINGLELFTELKSLSRSAPNDVNSPSETLKYLFTNRFQESMPNVVIALRILLTIPVTVASAERSFSKLKLIKTYLRSSMLDDRLSALALISIENDLATSINFSELIRTFAAKKARKIDV